MPRRPFLLLLLALPAVIACGGKEPAPKPERVRLDGAARGWNVVLISVDTLRADRLGAYGYEGWPNHPPSPAIDAQLASGVVFEQAMATRAETWPSLGSLLTGLYPSGHGVVENGYGFPDALPTLPKILHHEGYRTGAFLSNMCDANHQGWDDFRCSGGRDGKTVQAALDWMRAHQDGRKPFFLWVHLFGAHGPYYNGGDLADRELDPGYQGPIGPRKWQLNRVMTEKIPLTGRDVRHLDALYDASVIGSDRLTGSLLEGLRAAGRLEKTVVIFTADHGEELYDHHGYLYHACSVYQTGLHVPLGISAPGLLPKARVAQTVELIDVLPTLLSLLGITVPEEQHGHSLVPYLERPDAGGAGKPAFSEYGSAPIHTVAQGGWKLVHNPTGFAPVCIQDASPGHYPIAREELYDLSKDPGETDNLATAQPAKVAELSSLIRQRFAGLKSRAQEQDVDEETRKQLEALGYVSPKKN